MGRGCIGKVVVVFECGTSSFILLVLTAHDTSSSVRYVSTKSSPVPLQKQKQIKCVLARRGREPSLGPLSGVRRPGEDHDQVLVSSPHRSSAHLLLRRAGGCRR